MVRNWNNLIQLLIPEALRRSRLLAALASALTSYTRSKFDAEHTATMALLDELRHTGQTLGFVSLLNDKFDPVDRRIRITDGTDAHISLCWQDAQTEYSFAGTNYDIYLAIPDRENTYGEDFTILVPLGTDTDRLRAFVNRYIFYGLTFKIQFIS